MTSRSNSGAVKKILAQISAKGEKTDPAAILALLSRFRNGGERAAVFGDPSVRAMAEHIRSRYESALRACNAVDFDDLILLTLRLFKEHPEALEACRAKYRYVMVDEYQDTNAAQFKLVQALTREHRNLCVVGDDDQSIYGWRGAEIANLLDMEKHFPETKVIKLEQNYRSTNTILNAANAIIKHNVRRRGKKLWSQKGDGPKITLHTFANDEEEARTIAEQIEYARLAQRVPWADQAILFRTNAQSRPLETALRQAGVRYHLIGGQSFFDRREIRDFLAYLKALLNPNDDVSLLRIANVPARGLSDVTMERLLAASHERKCPVFAVMKNPAVTATFQARTRESIEGFVELIERTRGRLHTESLSRDPRALQTLADQFLDEIGYFAELRRSEKNPETAENRIRNLKDLIATLDGAEAAAQPPFDRLQAFLEQITLDTEREEEEDEAPGDAVTLITMHSCKGLEFPERVYCRPGGRPAAALALEGGGHARRGAAAVLRRRHARHADAHHQPLRRAEEIRQPRALPSFAVPQGAAARAGGARRREGEAACHARVRQGQIRPPPLLVGLSGRLRAQGQPAGPVGIGCCSLVFRLYSACTPVLYAG